MIFAIEDPIYFESPEEFRQRPLYVTPLRIAPQELDSIIGKYDFSEEIPCSLNGCVTPHKRGFVIRAKNGMETNCGNVCGKREFDVEWEELEATFKKAEQLMASKQLLSNLLDERDGLIVAANKVLPRLEEALVAHNHYMKKLGATASFQFQLLQCIKIGGAVKAARPASAHEIENKIKPPIVTVARINGGSVVFFEKNEKLPTTLRTQSLKWLESLDPAKILMLEHDGIKALLAESKIHRSLIEKAEKYADDASVFFSAENEKAFQAVRLCLMKKGGDRDAMETLISSWAQNPRGLE